MGIVFFHDAVHQLFDVSGIPVEARFYALLIHGGVQRLQDGGGKRQRHIPDAQLDDGTAGILLLCLCGHLPQNPEEAASFLMIQRTVNSCHKPVLSFLKIDLL